MAGLESDLAPDAMHQTMSGSESEAELHSKMALREDGKSKSPLMAKSI